MGLAFWVIRCKADELDRELVMDPALEGANNDKGGESESSLRIPNGVVGGVKNSRAGVWTGAIAVVCWLAGAGSPHTLCRVGMGCRTSSKGGKQSHPRLWVSQCRFKRRISSRVR